MYISDQTIISKNNFTEIYQYADTYAVLSKNLYNAALFRVRQIFTGSGKETRTLNEAKVFDEVSLLEHTYPSIHVKKVISYSHLEKMMRVTHNPDFFAGLPMQTAQAVVKSAVQDFKNWLASLRAYKKDPSSFSGKPKMPGYKKSDRCTFTVTNQDAVLYPVTVGNGVFLGMELKLPCTKARLFLPHLNKDSRLMEVKIKPYHGRYILSLIISTADIPAHPDMPETAAIDFGVDNIAAIVCTDHSSRIYKGGAILSENQWFAKERARAVAVITKGHEHMHADSRYLRNLSFHHANFNKDQMHKISADIIRFCLKHRAGTLVLGVNRQWKQHSDIGSVNNQKFVSVPTALLRALITYKAGMAGIRVIMQEESYTSKADITAMDHIPVYGMDDDKASFSGHRMKRGLYRCYNGLIINADCNGAANIMRKAIPDIWNGCNDFSFLASPEVSGFHELNPLSIPVRRIVAA